MPERDPFQLRALPQEDVFFHCKKIDNSRLVREADPQARGACWSAIGTACVVVVVLTSVLVPNVASTLAGYKLQALRVEERQLLDEKRTLEVVEAQLQQDRTEPGTGEEVRIALPAGSVRKTRTAGVGKRGTWAMP